MVIVVIIVAIIDRNLSLEKLFYENFQKVLNEQKIYSVLVYKVFYMTHILLLNCPTD